MTELTSYAVAVGLAAVAAITDWRTGRIPNWLTLPPLVAAPVVYTLLAGPYGGLLSLLGAGICGAGPYVMFRRGAMGGGDVKLLAAIGAIAGITVGLEGQLLGYLIASLYVIACRAFGGGLLSLMRNCVFMLVNPVLPPHWRGEIRRQEMTPLRLGGFILLGVGISSALRYPPLWG